jgi:hypothetical protein
VVVKDFSRGRSVVRCVTVLESMVLAAGTTWVRVAVLAVVSYKKRRRHRSVLEQILGTSQLPEWHTFHRRSYLFMRVSVFQNR